MPLVKPLSKRRARCDPEALGDAFAPVVPSLARLEAACRPVWGRTLDWSIRRVAPSGDWDLNGLSSETVATTALDGGWLVAWSGTLLSRAVAVALQRPLDPVELRRPLTRFDCGAGAWVLTRALTDWLGQEAPRVRHMEPGWCPSCPLPPWCIEVAWRAVERGRLWIFTPQRPSSDSTPELSERQRRRMIEWPVEVRPRLEALPLSPGALEALRPGDLIPLSRVRWREGRLSGPVDLVMGSQERRAWLEVPHEPASPALRLGPVQAAGALA